MDVLYFLKERTIFIRWYYDTAGKPFREIMRKIDERETPIDSCEDETPFRAEDEPPFLEEWTRAETALEMLGRTCISMLSACLRLFLETWEAELGIKWENGEKAKYFGEGFVRGYLKCFGEPFNLKWEECPADFEILEQIALVRNKEQHPDCISTMQVRYNPKTISKFSKLFFLGDDYELMFPRSECPWYPHPIHISREKLLLAINEVELLGGWLQDRIRAR